ncbi:hypothetical protein D3C81_199700 [compost metagenome]
MAIDREVGAFPLSIGTSYAIEGLLGIHPGNPNQPSGHKGITTLWINIRTLVRNYREAMKTDDRDRIKYDSAAIMVLSEMQAIPEILKFAKRNIEVVFYHQAIEDIRQQFPNANYKTVKTDNQVAAATYETFTLRFLLAECVNAKVPVQQIRRQPTPSRQVAAILTHYPKDLFWKGCFERLFLLESHTGQLKTYVDWYSKLIGIKSDNQVPLNEFTIQVFGDKHLFEGQDKKIKTELKELARVKRWNATTAMGKVSSDILGYGSVLLKETYRKLLP